MKRWLALIAAATFLVLGAGCSDDDDCPTCPDNGAPTQSYVGSATCGTSDCHEHDNIYANFIKSGHPYKLSEVVGNEGPTFPYDDEHTNGAILWRDGPPPNTNWSDFSYTIGGYGWKSRFVKPDGKVYTTGAQAQLNLWADGVEWVPYEQGNDNKLYNYSCFRCHTTGASEEGSWPEGSSEFGTFAFGGVQCEECHGQGAQHVSDPKRFAMVVDPTAELCGRCHTRDSQNRVAVSGGYIKHHEQYDEMIHSPHAAVGCGGCHDAHSSVVYDDVAPGDGVIATCESCHSEPGGPVDHNAHNGVPTCTNCHMPKAAKSARVTSNPHVADVASHTFMIETAAVDKSAMWTSDGKFLNQDEFGRGRITLDFACYSCHKDDENNPTNPDAPFNWVSLENLSIMATGIHDAPPTRMVNK